MFSTLVYVGNCCPKATALESIPEDTCKLNMGQLQRDFYARRGIQWDIATPANNLPATIAGEAIEDAAGWAILLAATDDTKVAYTPLIGGDSVIEAGGAVTNGGGDNGTLNGEVQQNGTNPATVTKRFDALASDQIAAMRKLQCEDTLEVYLVSGDGSIWAWKDGDVVTGIPVLNFYVGTKANNGYGTRDSNVITYQIPFNYDEYLYRITPADFNALTIKA